MTDRYAVIGNPIGHSKSPLIHGTFAKQTQQDLNYTAIEGPMDGFEAAVRAFRDGGGKGMNVTAPFKLRAFEMATDRLERARLAGATNALKFESDRILADNFDGVGLVNDIQRNLGVGLAGRRVLMLGAGGAARGAVLPILEQRPQALVVVNRSIDKATALVREFKDAGPIAACGYGDLNGERFELVINATSASLRGELPPVPAEVCTGATLAYEFAYGKGLTPFLRLARNAGVPRLADGVGMLVEQAAEAFVWWRDVRPQTQALIERLAVPLT